MWACREGEEADKVGHKDHAVGQSAQQQHMAAAFGKQGVQVKDSAQQKQGPQQLDSPPGGVGSGAEPGKQGGHKAAEEKADGQHLFPVKPNGHENNSFRPKTKLS